MYIHVWTKIVILQWNFEVFIVTRPVGHVILVKSTIKVRLTIWLADSRKEKKKNRKKLRSNSVETDAQ